ncbi:TadE-like protein [Litorimonas taeanensis]|uniref:TadE-like protein n=1 Tax=Litorimonas taeanensis TaxID=568099 RepID=A0A420WMF9_9PROT|nr:TadE family protein [Litorimonas taeanensis]RKQ72075.1 TadE-like protein [Litorimonas taeanensis]
MSFITKTTFNRLYRRARRIRSSDDGSAAIEFAILAIPFLMLIFGIVELAIILFINSSMSYAVSEAGRQIRVGNFQACGGNSAEKFKELVCENMSSLGNCKGNVRVDVLTGSNFARIILPEAPDIDADEDAPNGSVDNTLGGNPVVARATYYYKLAMPAALTRLETREGSGIRMLYSSTAFRNEPFSTPGDCPI